MQKLCVPANPAISFPNSSNLAMKEPLPGGRASRMSARTLGRISLYRRICATVSSLILLIGALLGFVCPQQDSSTPATAQTIIQQAATAK